MTVPKDKPLFCEGIYPTVVHTQYGDIINLKIDVMKLRRNLTLEDENGNECIYAQLLTNREGGKYAVMNMYKYHQKKQDEDTTPPF